MQDPKITIDEKKKTMTIVVPLQKPKSSKSGKTLVIASTHGNFKSDVQYEGKPITMGLNAYIKPE